ncbi:hypothetical protein C6P45_004880 [Maudiozyma exigua]|uniref:PA14 domain-containing protein n=1 Tax=Maudiozyma exigua TaxID=34358 RepID=A0A9P6WBB9_MAUEX|nr:hypothetical protein C6P45_004880 [Kazachstania exigua]
MHLHFFQLLNSIFLALFLHPYRSNADRTSCLPNGPSSQGFTARFFPYPIGSPAATTDPTWLQQDYTNNDPIGETSGILDPNYNFRPCIVGAQLTCPLSSSLTSDGSGRLKCGSVYCLNRQNSPLFNKDMFGFKTTPTNITVELSGYLYTKQTGNYIFSLNNIDDGAVIVVGGDMAFPCCGQAAPDIGSNYFSDVTCLKGAVTAPPTCQTTISLSAGNYYPVRIVYTNSVSVGNLGTSLTLPDGTVINNWGTQVYSYLDTTYMYYPQCQGGYIPPSSTLSSTNSMSSVSPTEIISSLSSLFSSSQSSQLKSISSVLSASIITLTPPLSQSSPSKSLSSLVNSQSSQSLNTSRTKSLNMSSTQLLNASSTNSFNGSITSGVFNETSIYTLTQGNDSMKITTISKLVSRAMNMSSISSMVTTNKNNTKFTTFLLSNSSSQFISTVFNTIPNLSRSEGSEINRFTSISPQSTLHSYNVSGSNTMMSGGSRSVVTLSPSDMMSGSIMTASNGSSYYVSGSILSHNVTMRSLSHPSVLGISNGNLSTAVDYPFTETVTIVDSTMYNSVIDGMDGRNLWTSMSPEDKTYDSVIVKSTVTSLYNPNTYNEISTDGNVSFTRVSDLSIELSNPTGSSAVTLTNMTVNNSRFTSVAARPGGQIAQSSSSYANVTVYTVTAVENSVLASISDVTIIRSVPITVTIKADSTNNPMMGSDNTNDTFNQMISIRIPVSSMAMNSYTDTSDSGVTRSDITVPNHTIRTPLSVIMTSQVYTPSISDTITNSMTSYNGQTLATSGVFYSNISSTQTSMNPSHSINELTSSNNQLSDLSRLSLVSTSMAQLTSKNYGPSTSLTSPFSSSAYSKIVGFKSVEDRSMTSASGIDMVSYSKTTTTSYGTVSISEEITLLSVVTETRRNDPISFTSSLSPSQLVTDKAGNTERESLSSYIEDKSYPASASSPQMTAQHISHEAWPNSAEQSTSTSVSGVFSDDTPSQILTQEASKRIVSQEIPTINSKIISSTTQPISMNTDDGEVKATRTSSQIVSNSGSLSRSQYDSEGSYISSSRATYLGSGSAAVSSMFSRDGHNEVQASTDSAIERNSIDSKSTSTVSTILAQSRVTSKTQPSVTINLSTPTLKSNSKLQVQTSSANNVENASVTTYQGSGSSLNINHMLATIFIFIKILI